MRPIDNLGLLDYSLKYPEPYIDNYYIKKGNLIISDKPKELTPLMRANLDLIKGISAYEFACDRRNNSMMEAAINQIYRAAEQNNINFSEFVSFWPVVDISYSVYKKLTSHKKKMLLRQIIDKYIKMRHEVYLMHGYTPTTLQVGKDAKAHKESGSPGLRKVSDILGSHGFKSANHESVVDFTSKGVKKYIEADKKGKRLFKALLKHYRLQFNWSRNRQGKMPDFLLRHNNSIIIIEHKHVKEGGGGQDKAINEIISFVGYSEDNISFVSFLDGTYFNLLAENISKKNKLYAQLNNIKSLLRGNRSNYFVNTAGFKKLLSCLT
jgi:hypothetical protein